MGQMTTGILYGCVVPKLPGDSEEPDYDLICRWEKAEQLEPYGGNHPRIRREFEGGQTLIGVWVAVGGSGEDGAPYFLERCIRLDFVEVEFARRIRDASLLWKRFAAHVKATEGIKLPKPALWLTPCETA